MTQFTTGQPVTVTITDESGNAHVFDGFVKRADLYVVTDMTRAFNPHTPVPSGHYKHERPFLVIESASGRPYGHELISPLRQGIDHLFSADTIWVAVDGEHSEVVAADDDAAARIDATLSPERVVAKVTALLTETDPVLAKRLAMAVEEIETAAYTRGGDDATDCH